ncbi:MAG: TonB-dependent receptor [Deltaproteobacteria bacterium]|nr:TonB-dependent receptor [Deltaproteobacteria bacterium]
MKTLIIVFSLLLISATVFADEINGDSKGLVKGVIFSAEDNLPISNARIFSQQEPQSVVETKDGVFEIELNSGHHNLLIFLGGDKVADLGDFDVVAGKTVEVVARVDKDGNVIRSDIELSKENTPVLDIENTDLPLSFIEGVVLHEETGQPVKGMKIFVRGINGETQTDENGKYKIELPVGTYDLSFLHQDFTTISKKDVLVKENEITTLNIDATPLGVTLADYVVSAPKIEGGSAKLMEERQESSHVEDVIGAEQMAKTGDSNAASALKRVTGITVVGGKYVYVRGLGERYSSTLFNGAMLPSPEPERRVIPLDMFPSGMLESVVIQKSYSPEMPGEFGGGVVMLRSRNYPKKFLFDVSLSGEIVTGTTFSDGWKSVSGTTDWLGVDGGFRDLDPEFVKATKDQKLVEGDLINPGFTLEDIERLGESMPKQWKSYKETVPPGFGASVSIGNTFKLRKIKLGVLASGMYDNDWESLEQEYTVYNMGANGMEPFHSYSFENTTNTVKTAAFLALGLEFSKNHKIRSTTMINRISDNMTRWYEGHNRDVDTDIRVLRIRWVERQLFSQQLLGEHVLEPLHNLGIDWRYTYSRATRDEPLRRQARYDLEDAENGIWKLSNRPDGNSLLYSDLLDTTHDIGFDLNMPFDFKNNTHFKISTGGAFAIRNRESDTRRFTFNTKKSNSFPSTGDTPLSNDPHELFNDEFIGPFKWVVEGEDGPEDRDFAGMEIFETTQPTDNYTASQNIAAGYLKVDLELFDELKLMGGVRIEKSDQSVKTFELFTPTPQVTEAKLKTVDPLPAVTANWTFVKDMVLRAGYGRTVSRPEFRELSEARFNDVTGGRDLYGNPDLKRATIDNFDLRWDWFWESGNVLSFGGFYKYFNSPIEVSIDPAAQTAMTWRNAKSAKNFGLEFDIKRSFAWITEKLSDFYFAGNASYIFSRVQLTEAGIQTSDKRPLQGQSPYVINAQLGYDNIDQKFSAIILYNVFGARISEVGASGLPDTYEQPFQYLNFVIKKKFRDRFGASFKIQNILNQYVHFVQGGKTTFKYRPGVSFSLGLGFSM